MNPEELFKRRRHHFTPEATKLIIANFITITVALSMFGIGRELNWFFWVVLAGLAVYNFFNIRRNYEEYGKPQVIGYLVSLAVLILLFVLLRWHALHP